MRFFGSALLIIMAAAGSPAQTPTTVGDPPDLQVIKMSWKSQYRLAHETQQEEQDPLAGQPERSTRGTRGGRVSVYDQAAGTSRGAVDMWPAGGPPVKGYLYQAIVRNTGQKEIKAVQWQYVFTDPFDPRLVSRHRFHTKLKIAPGKEKKLDYFSLSPPSQIVNAKAVAGNAQQPYLQQVLVTRIDYVDGAVWERAGQ